MMISPVSEFSSSELDLLARAMALEWRRRIPHSPQTPTAAQGLFLGLAVREALYGGAAGGGKSSALLMAALQYVHVPGYAAIIFRRTYADLALPGAIMDRAKSWLAGKPGVHWNENEKTFTFECAGGTSSISFGYLQTENDKYRYQGAEFQFEGWDEVTQFTETQYRYLLSRLRRRKGVEIPLRVRCASNPGGEGHEWVLQRFIIEGPKVGRTFVPAKLADNPHLDREEYEKTLQELDPVTRAQLLNGDWTVRPKGSLFDRAWFEVVDAAPAQARRVRYWDFAATEAKAGKDPDWTVGAKVALAHGVYFVEDVKRTRAKPGDVEALVKSTASEDGRGVEVVLEQEPGSSGVHMLDHYRRTVLVGWSVRGDKKTGNKLELAKPISSASQAGNVKIVRGAWNRAWLDELESFPTEGVHDDQVDATSGAARFAADGSASFGNLTDRNRPQWPTRM